MYYVWRLLSRFGIIVRTARRSCIIAHTITDADDRYTRATTVDVINELMP